MSQYRCETCKHRGEYTEFGDKCPMRDTIFSFAQMERITLWCGCASHSDSQSERDKVLDEPTDKDITKAALYDSIRPEIRRMVHRMEQKFRLHDQERGDPFRCDDQYFMDRRMLEESTEFYEAMGLALPYFDHNKLITRVLFAAGKTPKRKRPFEVWDEAGDWCNIITMMAVNYERDYWKELRQQAGEQG
jgi:hypothetical protein